MKDSADFKKPDMIKYYFTLILLSTVTCNAFGQDTTYFDSQWIKSTADEAFYYQIELITEDGFIRTDYYTSNSQIQMQGKYLSKNPEIKTGEFKWYYENGNIKHIGEYSDNKEIGTHKWYFDNGEIEAIENYSLGKYNGEYKEYYSNGKPLSVTSFSNGVQNGLTKYYREDGSIHSEGQFKNGDRNGTWNYYDEQQNLLGTIDFKTEYIIDEANMFLKLPNSEWSLTNKIEGDLTQYYFKRNPITDKNGLEIIPAIMVYIEDASKYNQDVTLFSIDKQMPLRKNGIGIDKILIHENEEFPLTFENAYFIECSYSSEGLDHIFYMIHIINKENIGIQIYLDMTKDIADDYENEFWTTIKSIKLQ